MEKTDELIAFLGKQQLFVGFSPAQLDEIIILLEEVKVASGTYIIRENEPSDNIYIIKEGELKVTKWDPAHQREHHLTTLRTGAMVGDGLNDYVTYDLVTRFVGYGGIFYRENMAKNCEYYIRTASLSALLPLAITQFEYEHLLPNEQALYHAGLATISAPATI